MHHHNKEKYEKICEFIKNVDANSDAILQTMKIRTISEEFTKIITDEKALSEIFDAFNARALEDENFVMSLVSVMSSRQMENFQINNKIVRHAMLGILQKNFQNGENFKRDNIDKFYNSVRLLGEYYNKARSSNGYPINIIGQSLLNVLSMELEKELKNVCHFKNDQFSKLVLSQITLNGTLLKTRHKNEVDQLLFNIRRCLIELDSLTPKSKAFLIMSLDLYYSNFTNVGDALEKMYQTFLVDGLSAPKKPSREENGKITRTENENKKNYSPPERLPSFKKSEEAPARYSKPVIKNQKVTTKKPEPTKISMQQKSHQRSSSQSSKTPPPSITTSSSQRKVSPKDLRVKSKSLSPKNEGKVPSSSNKVPMNREIHPDTIRNESSNESEKNLPLSTNSSDSNVTSNGDDVNILKQQNSRSSTPSTPAKHKANNTTKIYFREENVENLTWNTSSTSFDGEDPDASTSPKVNPYSSSFLSFLGSN